MTEGERGRCTVHGSERLQFTQSSQFSSESECVWLLHNIIAKLIMMREDRERQTDERDAQMMHDACTWADEQMKSEDG